jgi:cadmium resistance protein CadD (predicted permease)
LTSLCDDADAAALLQADKKIAATSTVRFTNQLAREISWFQPLFMTNGTQVCGVALLLLLLLVKILVLVYL